MARTTEQPTWKGHPRDDEVKSFVSSLKPENEKTTCYNKVYFSIIHKFRHKYVSIVIFFYNFQCFSLKRPRILFSSVLQLSLCKYSVRPVFQLTLWLVSPVLENTPAEKSGKPHIKNIKQNTYKRVLMDTFYK